MEFKILFLVLFIVLLNAKATGKLSSSSPMNLLKDYTEVINKMKLVIPTVRSGNKIALDNLKTLRRIMVLVKNELNNNKDKLPKGFNGIEKLDEAMEKIDKIVGVNESNKSSTTAKKATKKTSLLDTLTAKAKAKSEKAAAAKAASKAAAAKAAEKVAAAKAAAKAAALDKRSSSKQALAKATAEKAAAAAKKAAAKKAAATAAKQKAEKATQATLDAKAKKLNLSKTDVVAKAAADKAEAAKAKVAVKKAAVQTATKKAAEKAAAAKVAAKKAALDKKSTAKAAAAKVAAQKAAAAAAKVKAAKKAVTAAQVKADKKVAAAATAKAEAKAKVSVQPAAQPVVKSVAKSAVKTVAAPQAPVVSGVCTEGPCCDVETQTFKLAGTGCVIDDPCKEPASLCTGLSATCETTNQPDGTICGEGKACYDGVCSRNKKQEMLEKEAFILAEKEKEIRKKKAIAAIEHDHHKKFILKQKDKAMKHMLKRFAVLSWMNKKINSWEADIEVSDYVSKLPKAPSAEEIFKHQYVGPNNQVFDQLNEITIDEESTSESSATETKNTTSTTNLKSAVSNVTEGSGGIVIGVAIIAVALILIVAYFIFGGKKSPDADVIY